MNNALTKIATAQAAAGGRYPRFGRYLLEVEVIRTKEGFKGDSAIAELKVRESEPLAGGETPSRPGETVDYVENLSTRAKRASSPRSPTRSPDTGRRLMALFRPRTAYERMQVRIGVQRESLQERRARRRPHDSAGAERALQ